ncbi:MULTISPECIES: class I SAM-dependent methyltransferase [Fischerella]|uniref:Class I SAM-dependent methyltransferase n=1 Tax=Fischerella muscicola CCMEE 5323 TaxID=2019572 RepID=A0A2N6JW84_FISMU|nr:MULTISPECIES: class I SAM-dependent methyltransferase [Fischerella]MBD2433410.1 class I SAM-dependent methyltransferase [Fischerella sp. FACHB-380]PLZ84316.1 class I SAM-dependent methyltransferase [Fischerella muscicola CCMEE 5323]
MALQTLQQIDQSKAEAFAQGMLGILNSSAIALMTSIGHRTGLFDTLAQLPASTSQHIADTAGLNERYVREWLGAMVTGGIVEYDPSDRTYLLPPEHALFLTRSGDINMAATLQMIPILATVEDQIIECFYKGGGVPYSAYKRFHQVMAEESNQTVVEALIDSILPLVPGSIEALQTGIDVLDVGCGSGHAMNRLAQIFPQSRFTGYDFSTEAIATAKTEAQNLGLTNVQFQVKDAATIDEIAQYDLITTFDAIHDQAKPDVVLYNIAQALRPDGTYLMQDIRASSYVDGNLEHPTGPFLYTVSCMHCMTVSLAMNGAGLGTVWGEEKALEMLKAAGFNSVEVKRLEHDILNNYYIVKKIS